tara:strand:- start:725 stop:955 length:231 start_codon:yes stop_codon:yes gene_type:complete
MSDKLNNKKKKLAKGCLVYRLEIAYDKDSNNIEYICETIDKEGFSGPIDISWEYMEEYFDDEDIAMMDSLYDVGEA